MRTANRSQISSFLNMLTGKLGALRRRRGRMSELQEIGESDLRRIAGDTGLTRADLLALAGQDEDSAQLLHRRLAEMGLDATQIDVAVLRDMQRCCSQCDSKAKCLHELEDQPKSAAWPKYCPNQDTLASLTAMKCH